jgi:hypothetical protein
LLPFASSAAALMVGALITLLVLVGPKTSAAYAVVAGWAHDAGGLSMLRVIDIAIAIAGLAVFLLCARVLHEHPWRSDQRAARLG